MRDPLAQLRLRFADLRLVSDGERVRVYAGRDFSGYEVSVAVLTAGDQELRRAFAEAAGRARTAATSVQSDVHAPAPWLAARHPEGLLVVHRFAGELDRHAYTMPAGSLTLAPLPVDAPLPVWPDPTAAPTPPPVELSPAIGPVPPAPATPPPPRPVRARPVPPRPVDPPRQLPRAPAPATSSSMSPASIFAMVVVGLVVLMVCCGSSLANLL